MDIKQLHYISAIVKNDFNLSQACKELYVSQPTLSVMVNDFEKKENIKIFRRKNGRLTGLTEKGIQYYKDALEVIKAFDKMRDNLHSDEIEMTGEIKIGIPRLINTLVFSDVLPKAILENNTIAFNIIEDGAYNISSQLLSEDLDIAVLLHPEPISDKFIETYTIAESELSVAVSSNHKFANRESIDWQELHLEDMCFFDKTFMANHLFEKAIGYYQINPNIVFESSSWDFLVEAVINHDHIFTILPYTLSNILKKTELKLVKINDPLPWTVTLCRLKKDHYSEVENFVLEYLLNYFNKRPAK